MRSAVVGVCVPLLLLACAGPVYGEGRYVAVRDPQSPQGMAYTRYHTTDRFDRRITFYIDGNQDERLPIVVFVSGSGAYSHFMRDGERIVDGHRTERAVFAGRAHLLIIEKPGIEFLEQHSNRGTAVEGSALFHREHTLERWAEAVSAAIRAARGLPLTAPDRCLVIGHSEGGIVAARVAAENVFVTHVATLAGGGPVKLFDFVEAARAGRLYAGMPPEPEKQVARLLSDVAEIRSDPESADRFFLGHPFRRWSSFWSSSTVEELSRTRARVFIGQGTADVSGLTGSDVVYATLLARGRPVVLRRVAGGDHGFGVAEQPDRDGWLEMFQAIRAWLFE